LVGPTDPLSRAAQGNSFARSGRQIRSAGPPRAAVSLGRADRSAQQDRPEQQFRFRRRTWFRSSGAEPAKAIQETPHTVSDTIQVAPIQRKQSKKLRISALLPLKWRRTNESNPRNSAYQLRIPTLIPSRWRRHSETDPRNSVHRPCFRSSGAEPAKAIQDTPHTNSDSSRVAPSQQPSRRVRGATPEKNENKEVRRWDSN